MSEFRIDLDAVQKTLNGHSIFAPSSSAMWLHCSGSLIANLLAPDDAGEDAAYGTVGHSVGERWLKTGLRPTWLVGTVVQIREGGKVFDITIDNKMLDYVEQYVLWCAPLPGTHFVERRVYFSQLTPLKRQGGTADHVVCANGVMTITDLKMGMGYRVMAKQNPQAMLYALGFFYDWDDIYDFQKFVIRIAQPRLDHFDEWTCTREELLEFAEFVKVRSALAWVNDAPRSPSPSACRWCRVSTSCTARLVQLVALMRGDFTKAKGEITVEDMAQLKLELLSGTFSLDGVDVKSLSTEDLSMLYPFIDGGKLWWEKLNSELYKRAMAGQPIATAKLIRGRTTRKWKNEKAARQRLMALGLTADQITTVVTASPAQAEELLREHTGMKRADLPKALDGLISKPPAGLTLAPISSKAQSQDPSAIYDNVFDDLNEREEI